MTEGLILLQSAWVLLLTVHRKTVLQPATAPLLMMRQVLRRYVVCNVCHDGILGVEHEFAKAAVVLVRHDESLLGKKVSTGEREREREREKEREREDVRSQRKVLGTSAIKEKQSSKTAGMNWSYSSLSKPSVKFTTYLLTYLLILFYYR